MVDAAIQTFLREFGVAQFRPRLPPMLQGIGTAPVGGGYGVEHIISGLVPDVLAVFVQHIFPALLVAPPAVRQDGPDRAQHMEVRVLDAAVLSVWLVYGEVYYHATGHKVLQQKLPCEGDVLLHGEFVLQGNVKTVCKLGFLPALGLLYGVPEGLPVCIFRRGLGRQQDFGTDHAALAGVVAVLAVILAVQLFAGAVGGGCHNRLPGAAFDLRYMKMEQCDRLSLSFLLDSVVSVDGGHEQAFDLRQSKRFFCKGVELGFSQNLYQRLHAFDGRAAGDEPVGPLAAVAFLVVAAAVFQLLLFVLELGNLALLGGDFSFQLRDCFLFWHGA